MAGSLVTKKLKRGLGELVAQLATRAHTAADIRAVDRGLAFAVNAMIFDELMTPNTRVKPPRSGVADAC